MEKQIGKKINFQLMTDEITEGLTGRPSLLLHSCCGPCSSYVLSYLKEFFDITVLFYNPNIFPEEEFNKRLLFQKQIISCLNADYPDAKIKLKELAYNHDEFLSAASGFEKEPEGGARCEKCFELRIGKASMIAAQEGFEFFATTLSVSPHKNALVLNKVGERAAGKAKWLYSDFKKKDGYKQSIELSKKYNLYRQDYCGCEFAI